MTDTTQEEKAAKGSEVEYEELAARLLATEAVSEDIAVMLARNWQKVLTALLLVVLAVWIIGEARAAVEKRREEEAFRFSEAQRLFPSVIAGGAREEEKEDDAEKAHKSFEESLKMLNKGSGSTYAKSSALYLAQAALGRGERAQALEYLAQYPLAVPPYSRSADSPTLDGDRVLAELSLLLRARILAGGEEQDLGKAREVLNMLVDNAALVNLEALLALLRLAPDIQALDQLEEKAQKLARNRPELGDLIEQELKRYGLRLEEKEA